MLHFSLSGVPATTENSTGKLAKNQNRGVGDGAHREFSANFRGIGALRVLVEAIKQLLKRIGSQK
ncbi:hypothetical protein HD598_000015 [Neomicrococcus aestuarii]|uniref:Uncharacterized protein n=1 Tax=Neomicrococcus aestuarii TaxID=556325 RepID=A0A7W8TRB4_9MICC|nr:hypothetical protein [Neomicrococcus aestuarii]MBB5511328.1 hypothetical protein [Neomicrococcus aestuarii]